MLDNETFQAVSNSVTFLWLLGWALHALRNLLSSRRDSISFVIVAHLALCGLPLLLDEVAGKTDYLRWPGFNLAAADGLTSFVYCLYVGTCPLLWWWFGRARRRDRRTIESGGAAADLRRMKWPAKLALHSVLLAPIAALYLAPNPLVYAQYAAVIRGTLSAGELAYHPMLAACALGSVIAGACLIVSQRGLKVTCAYVLPLAFLAVWVDGKRAVVLIVCALFAIALWSRGVLSRRTILFGGPAMALMFLAFSAFYQGQVRGLNQIDWARRYNNIRMDYGRDHAIRLTLYTELHPDAPSILEYRMQSLLFDASMLVPRDVWPGKPWPYAVYATAAAFRLPVRYLGWGVTTSWLEEAVANLSWAGLLAGPLLIGWICRMGDSQADPVVRLLTILVSCMLMAVQVAAFAPLILLWLLALARGQAIGKSPLRHPIASRILPQFQKDSVRA